jgi:antirestriction protein ArdC
LSNIITHLPASASATQPSREELLAVTEVGMLLAEVGIVHEAKDDAAGCLAAFESDDKQIAHASPAAYKADSHILGWVPSQQPAAVAA